MLPRVVRMLPALLTYGQHWCKTAAAMARTPIDQRPAIAQWLIRTREAHGLTASGFLSALGEGGPNYATYAQWESGATTPKPASLERVYRYWEGRGVPRFIEQAKMPALSYEERHLALLAEANAIGARSAAAAERQALALEALLASMARRTTGSEAPPELAAALLTADSEWARLVDVASQLPRHAPASSTD